MTELRIVARLSIVTIHYEYETYIEITWTISDCLDSSERCENTWPNIISDKTKTYFRGGTEAGGWIEPFLCFRTMNNFGRFALVGSNKTFAGEEDSEQRDNIIESNIFANVKLDFLRSIVIIIRIKSNSS